MFTSDDWDVLLPGEIVTIGNKKIIVRPFGIRDLKAVVQLIKDLTGQLNERGITKENYSKPEHIMFIAEYVLENAPALISKVTDIPVEDVNRLPLPAAIPLVQAIVEVNLKSKDDLTKNLEALADRVQEMTE